MLSMLYYTLQVFFPDVERAEWLNKVRSIATLSHFGLFW